MQCHMLLWRYGATPSQHRVARDAPWRDGLGRLVRAWRVWLAARATA